jgi:ornithine carbamoyltransferase
VLNLLKVGCAGEIAVSNSLEASLDGADVIYTDCWPPAIDEEEKNRIASLFLPYEITARHVAGPGTEGFFLPCQPVTRGQDVSSEAMNSPNCRNFEAKDDLLHIQNAIMEFVTGG